jgi:isopentenyl phosphate kinase
MSKVISPEIIHKIKEAKSAEELIAIVKKVGVNLSQEEAVRYYELLHPSNKELSDEDIDDVTGGISTIINCMLSNR